MRLDRRTLLGLAGAGLASGLAWNATQGSVSARVSGPEERPDASSEAVDVYVHELSGFGLDLLEAFDEESNLLLSPLSLSSALAMSWAGARGETGTQMRETLRFPQDQSGLHPTVGSLQYELNERAGAVPRFEVPQVWRTNRFELRVANALWGQTNLPFRESFLETTDRYYGGGFRAVDFENEPEASRERINEWAMTATSGRIDELLSSGELDETTRLVLTNAVYLLADWKHPFDPADTTDREFTSIDGTTERVPTMEQTKEFPAIVDHDADFQAVELPYVGDSLGMAFLLPLDRDTSFEAFEERVDADWLAARFAALDDSGAREIELRLPRFEFETEARLREPLAEMGMPLAFDEMAANFDGIAPLEEIGAPLYIDDVVHDTYISVDEAGTEAAAATGVPMGAVSGPGRIHIDRPFLFCLRDRETNAPLFLGRVVDASVMS